MTRRGGARKRGDAASRWTAFWRPDARILIGSEENPILERTILFRTPWFGLYLHHIGREDPDPAPHDHPWWFWSLTVRGSYVEEYYPDSSRVTDGPLVQRLGPVPARVAAQIRPLHRPRRFRRFPMTAAHRITSVEPHTVSLVLVGPKSRTWGFYAPDGRFVNFHDAAAAGLVSPERVVSGVTKDGKVRA